jgi:hypothetical protein
VIRTSGRPGELAIWISMERREAIKKLGKYAAFTSLSTMIILNPRSAMAQSGPPPQGFSNSMRGRRKRHRN